MAVVRELHALGATRVKVGDIEAEFPPRIPELPTERERKVERTPAEEEKDFRRIATASGDADDGDESEQG